MIVTFPGNLHSEPCVDGVVPVIANEPVSGFLGSVFGLDSRHSNVLAACDCLCIEAPCVSVAFRCTINDELHVCNRLWNEKST